MRAACVVCAHTDVSVVCIMRDAKISRDAQAIRKETRSHLCVHVCEHQNAEQTKDSRITPALCRCCTFANTHSQIRRREHPETLPDSDLYMFFCRRFRVVGFRMLSIRNLMRSVLFVLYSDFAYYSTMCTRMRRTARPLQQTLRVCVSIPGRIVCVRLFVGISATFDTHE